MARNRKNESAGLWLRPALKAGLICAGIVISCVGYVREKQEINVLAELKGKREARLIELQELNKKLTNQLQALRSPEQLDQRVKELNLGLGPAQPTQIWYRIEPGASTAALTAAAPQPVQRFASLTPRAEAAP
jgi:hypothetical protein